MTPVFIGVTVVIAVITTAAVGIKYAVRAQEIRRFRRTSIPLLEAMANHPAGRNW